jgi:hypothetical protein
LTKSSTFASVERLEALFVSGFRVAAKRIETETTGRQRARHFNTATGPDVSFRLGAHFGSGISLRGWSRSARGQHRRRASGKAGAFRSRQARIRVFRGPLIRHLFPTQ